MGCSNSKVESEELVARCRARKHFLKQAVYRRHALAASHAQYVVALKGAGSAFRQFAEGEVKDPALSATSFLPETPTSPAGFDLAPLPMPPPPPPPPSMSPSISPNLPPALPPPSPARLELPRFSPLPEKGPSPPPAASKKPNSNAVRNGILGANFKIPIPANRSPRANMPIELDKFLNSPTLRPPPLVPPVSFEEDWSSVAPRAPPPPPPLSPPREGMPPLPPPAHSGTWQQFLLDPSRPLPFPSSFPHSCEQRDHEQRQGLQAFRAQLQHLNLKQLGEEDIPELEDVDDNDDTIDCPPPKDSDDEELLEQEDFKLQEAKFPIVMSQPRTTTKNVQQQVVDASVLRFEPAELKPKAPIMRVNKEKTSKEMTISTVVKRGHGVWVAEKESPEAQKQLAWTLHNSEKQRAAGHDLLEVLKEVDDCFLHAAESSDKVSQMLETKKVHYNHSSFSDSFKGVGESARILNVSFRRLLLKSADRLPPPHQQMNGNCITLYSEDSATISSTRSLSSLSRQAWTDDGDGLTASHASTLDRLYAWEKKLYLEVKEAETLRNEFERKCAVYRNQEARGEDQQGIDKTRANIRMLQTRLAVAVEAVESAAAAVQRLRDDELYPQLLRLLEEMMNMWNEISNCHQSQMKAVVAMKRLDNSAAAAAFQEATTSSHRESTAQLEAALIKWVESLSKLVLSQREYVKSLTSWLRLSLLHYVEPERKELQVAPKLQSSLVQSTVNASPVYALCQQWQTSIDQMPDRVAIEAIAGFAAVVREMLRLQYEELRIRKKVEFIAHELERQQLSLHSSTMSMREMMISLHPPPLLHSPPTSNSGDISDMYGQNLDVISSRSGGRTTKMVSERGQQTETIRRRLEEEIEAERKAHIHTRAYTLNSLQTGLPFMFQALVSFSKTESEIYERLYRMGDRRHLDDR